MPEDHRDRPAPVSDSPLEPIADEGSYERLTSSSRIASILDEINRHSLVVSVRLETEGPFYDSKICFLDPNDRSMCLDAIGLEHGQARIAPGHMLDIHASLRGAAIRFPMQVEQVSPQQRPGAYCGGYPAQILYRQRRDIFRVHIPFYDRRYVKLRKVDAMRETPSRLIDISVKGFCIDATDTCFTEKDIGSRFIYTDMELPAQRIGLSGSAILINLRRSAMSGCVSAGFALEDMDPHTERALMQAALYYQREARRIERRDSSPG